MPLVKRHARLITRPTVPSTYAVTKPANVTEIGISTSPPSHTARRRSSGTHTPLRSFFARRTTMSDIRPEIGAPTGHVGRAGHQQDRGDAPKLPRPVGMKRAPIMPSLLIPYLAPCKYVREEHKWNALCVRTMVYAMGINSPVGSGVSASDCRLNV